jgi:hypothetical protein
LDFCWDKNLEGCKGINIAKLYCICPGDTLSQLNHLAQDIPPGIFTLPPDAVAATAPFGPPTLQIIPQKPAPAGNSDDAKVLQKLQADKQQYIAVPVVHIVKLPNPP